MFDIGQRVICIEDRFHPEIAKLYTALPTRGSEYVIRALLIGINADCKTGAVCVLLEGIVNPPSNSRSKLERGFDERRFRPMDEVMGRWKEFLQAKFKEPEQDSPYDVVKK